MSRSDASEGVREEELDPRLSAATRPAPAGTEPDDGDEETAEPSFFENRRRIAQTGAFVVVLVVGIYFLLPRIIADQDESTKRLGDADPVWVLVAVAFAVAMFAAYVALFRGIVGERVRLRWKDSYDITMAGLAATRLFSAGGAGGIVLTYWALRKAGMPRRETASRMVAFLVVLYAVYMVTLVVNGILMRTGVFDVPAPPGLTIVPAAIAGGVIIVFLLMALVPGDLERRFSSASQERLSGRIMRRLATVPSTAAVGTREAFAFVRDLSRGGLAVLGAVGFWGAQIGILWASFKAFGVSVPTAVIVQAFFVGMFANLIPLPGGVGGVDAGLLGAFALFGVGQGVFASVLLYRLLAFWLPIPPGIVAFLQLRKTVRGWEEARGSGEPPSGIRSGAAAATS